MSLSQKPALRLLIIGLFFLAAFGIRLYHITKPPLDFSPIRQYQSAHIARGYYFEALESIPEWKKEIARLNMQKIGVSLEPRIMEHLTVFGYRTFGGEYLWIPRVLSSIFWIIGGAFLYLIARKIASIETALFSTAFYLFLPYSISASRSFQPDPLMVMMLLFSIFLILRYFDQPSVFRLLIAAAFSALAMLIKPYCLFLIFGAFISLAIYRQGIRKAVISLNLLIFSIMSLSPTFVHYVYGVLSNAGFLRQHALVSFLPHLVLYPYFWKDWLIMIGRVVGYIAFMGAFPGFFMFRHGYSKALLAGLWIGYFLFGLSATYNIHTHDYYHLQLIPVIALSLGPIGVLVINNLINNLRKRWSLVVLCIVLLIIVAGITLKTGQIHRRNTFRDYKDIGAVIGVNPQFNEFLTRDFAKEVKIAQEIGEVVGHGTKNIFLTPYFGRVLTYHGEISGIDWPITISNLQEWRDRGLTIPTPEELYNSRFLKDSPEYFIVTSFEEFNAQPDLKDFLNKNFPLITQKDDYLIFDLRKRKDGNQG